MRSLALRPRLTTGLPLSQHLKVHLPYSDNDIKQRSCQGLGRLPQFTELLPRALIPGNRASGFAACRKPGFRHIQSSMSV